MKLKAYRSALGRDGYVSLVAENGAYICDGRKRFDNQEIIVDFSREQLGMDTFAEERVYCLALNTKMHPMGVFEVSRGTVNVSVCEPREVFQKLLALNATSFILIHNHPTGDATPSALDNNITDRMQKVGDLIGIRMTDHIIVGSYGNAYSFTAKDFV